MWQDFKEKCLKAGIIAVTQEIHDEMVQIYGTVGQCIKDNKESLLMEVGGDWDWNTYIDHVNRMGDDHKEFISEYNGGSKKTVCLNDISIVALAKTLKVLVVSMEAPVTAASTKKLRIPDVCALEAVEHLRFNKFLRKEKLKF
jgi:hypothetical protein